MTLPEIGKSFVGRRREVTSLFDALKRQDVRLITLTGFGGIGKTSLATHIAQSSRSLFSDGYAFIPLASIASPDLVARHIAQSLDLVEIQDKSPLLTVIDHLAAREMLFVLDNFEHLHEARSIVSELRDACPDIVILVTSRQRLRLTGEHVISLSPMSLPADGHDSTAQDAGGSDAVQLFVERARASRFTFELTDTNAADVSAICRTLEGIPLAIELAATRMRSLSTRDLLTHLTPRLQITPGGPLDSAERHQTMDAMIAWSYHLLPPRTQDLFRTLCVFSGGFSLDAATALAAGNAPEQAGPTGDHTLDLLLALDTLVEAHLVEFVEAPDGAGRYTMLESIRQYGLLLLDSSSEAAGVRQRHAMFFHALAKSAEQGYRVGDIATWNALIEPEQNNMRQALRWMLRGKETGAHTALDFITALWHFWCARAYWVEAIEWLRTGIAAANGHISVDLAKGWLYLGNSIFEDQTAARAAYEESLRIFQELDDAPGVTACIASLSAICEIAGEYDAGKSLAADALARLKLTPGDNERGIALVSIFLADLEMNSGAPENARRSIEQALDIWQRQGNERDIITAISRMGRLERLVGHPVEAIAHLQHAVDVSRKQGHQNAEYRDLTELGLALLDHGDPAAAVSALRQALRIAHELGVRDGTTARGLEGMARALAKYGMFGPASQLIGAAETVRVQCGSPLPLIEQRAQRREVASLRRAMGSATHSTQFMLGTTLTFVQAMEIAESTPLGSPGLHDGTCAPTQASPGPINPLSQREMEALCELVQGKSDREIGAALGVTQNTARTLVQRVRDKLGASNRHEVTVIAIRSGWCPGASPRDSQ